MKAEFYYIIRAHNVILADSLDFAGTPGYQEMANAAADALNKTYGFTIPSVPVPVLTPAQQCP